MEFRIGSYVKIRRNHERFWIEIKRVCRNKWGIGKVLNHLIMPHPYDFGDDIKFKLHEIIEVA